MPCLATSRSSAARVGIDGADAAAVAALGFRPQRVGFRKQPPGIERHHVDVEALLADPMEDELAFDAEAMGEDDAAVDRAAQKREAFGRPAGPPPRRRESVA